MTEEEFKALDLRSANPVKFAYQFKYPDMPEDCPDDLGRLLRKDDPPTTRWLSWQKSIQRASKHLAVTQDVLDYFHKTKHLVRPPKKGDLNIMQTGEIEDALIVTADKPRFTWSPSKLMDFETCPSMYAAKHYYKTIPYEETVHTIWGTRCHKQAELAMLDQECEDLEAYEVVRDYVRVLKTLPGERLVEYQISLDENWKPCAWEDGTGRMIVDLAIKDGKTLKCYDWKTGKMKDDPIQMQIYAYCLAILFPDVEDFDFRYIWLKDKKTTGFKLNRKDLLPVAKDVRARIARMKEAWDSENFRMKKNGLCKQWCGNKECPYCGAYK